MPVIYSYPKGTSIIDSDSVLGTDQSNKNNTVTYTMVDIKDYVLKDLLDGVKFRLPIYGKPKVLTNSLLYQDTAAEAGTEILGSTVYLNNGNNVGNLIVAQNITSSDGNIVSTLGNIAAGGSIAAGQTAADPSYRLKVNGASNFTGAILADNTLTVGGAAIFNAAVQANSTVNIVNTLTALGTSNLDGIVRLGGALPSSSTGIFLNRLTYLNSDTTLDPAATLALQGPIKDSSGVLGSNEQVLVSDANGKMSWQFYQSSGLEFQASWNASTDTPDLTSISLIEANVGKYWVVSVAGNTSLSGITDWQVGDWAIVSRDSSNTVFWSKIDNSAAITGTGTNNTLTKWTGPTTLGDSIVSESGTTLTITGNTTTTGDVQIDTLTNYQVHLPSDPRDRAITLNTQFSQTTYGEYPDLRVASRSLNDPGVLDLFRPDGDVQAGDRVGILQYSLDDDARYAVAQISVETLTTSGVGDSGGGKFIFKTTRGSQIGAIPESRFELDNGSADFSVPINVTNTTQSSFAGQVTIPLNPVSATDAASKGYVDGQNQNQVTGSGTVNTIPLWNTTTGLSDSVLSQTTPYIGPNTGILNINGTLKQSGTRKSIYIGENVGQSVNPTSGFLNIYNIGIGDDVLKDFEYGIVGVNLEDPGDNVGIGYQALTNLTHGTNNVAIGTETLKTLTLGGNNIALGKNSLLALTGTRANSIGNVALGFNTLSSMTTGTFNVAIGNTNFEAITTANSIVSIGNDIAKPFTGSASDLVMIGNKVLANTTATSITDGILIGQNSGLATSGTVTNDILIGRSVFQNNDSGGNNIAIGGNANQNAAGTVNTSIALTTRNGSGTGGNAGSYGIVISTYDSADVGVGSVNESTGKYSATIGGIGNLNQGGNGFIGGGKTNTIVATATNSAILGGFDNEVQSGGSGGMALGSNLQVNGNNQVVVGRFNTPNTNSKLIVGAGFSNANRINAFEVKNTSQLKLGKYGQTPANFPATSSSFVNVLVVGAANNVTEIPISNAEFNSQLLTPGTRSVTAGSTTNLSSQESKLVKISWTGTTGNAILRLPLAGNFVNKTIRFITDDSFPATASAQITGNGGTETINGLTAGVTLTGTYQAIMVWSDGLEWWTLSKNY